MKLKYAVITAATMIASAWAASAAIDINGGSSWGGWTDQGTSATLGIYGSGTTLNPYEIYTTAFTYSGNPVTGSPTGGGGAVGGFGNGFNNGDTILGVGIRMIGGQSVVSTPYTLKFDIGNNSYTASTIVANESGNGHTSGTTYATAGDFNVQNNTTTFQANQMTVYTGTHNSPPPGSYGLTAESGNPYGSTRPFASFRQTASYQIFVDLTQVAAWESESATYFGYPAPNIPAFGNTVTLALNGYGDNTSVISRTAVPEPSTCVAGALLLLPFGASAARMLRKSRTA